ncbi:hypothetical protein [Stenotrophomonas rhizophila]|uniref:hypothetical protein n=1 Tax=Stenotrophomonas rhizophila TaxID=216778 RepID=UPI001E6163E5|nr:hypothetical protein [Stenotrophomonas rhizophila]MCC7635517.1 hypothetical protein [Stenotrophomonas rhizophila]MCC7664717.1 hypothetical protein [Stenotrophomonas rhizophila]
MTLFLALCFVGVAIAGFSAFVIFWPLTLVHIRDRHPALADRFGAGAFLRPDALGWLLGRHYRQTPDRALSGLATPAWVALLTLLAGLGMAALLWLLSMVMT